MKRYILLIGIVTFSTFVVLIFTPEATSYLYNKVLLASGNEISECIKSPYTAVNCDQANSEYFHGLFWWSNITFFGILIIGVVIDVKLYKKKVVMGH